MIVDTPTIFVPETGLSTDTGNTLTEMVEENGVPEDTMDEYPEYWIG